MKDLEYYTERTKFRLDEFKNKLLIDSINEILSILNSKLENDLSKFVIYYSQYYSEPIIAFKHCHNGIDLRFDKYSEKVINFIYNMDYSKYLVYSINKSCKARTYNRDDVNKIREFLIELNEFFSLLYNENYIVFAELVDSKYNLKIEDL